MILADCKRGDIGSTAKAYVDNIFEPDESDFIKATQRVYRSRQHPTRLRVGVLSTKRE